MMKLFKQNGCVIVPNNPVTLGMLRKAKDYITWGEIDESLLKELIEKRGEPNPKDKSRTKSYFRLHPPRKGFGRAGVKRPFISGGALGNRAEAMADLVKRMI